MHSNTKFRLNYAETASMAHKPKSSLTPMVIMAKTTTKLGSNDRMAPGTQTAQETATTERTEMEEEDGTHQTPPPATTKEVETTHTRTDEEEKPTTIPDVLYSLCK
ncbi:hypothetical protein A2U01_0023871 [Trifolium medium]|uniref:Uncharacterized protein n=1 Tax=Trifolium medium TaxID=97028 RepID=A0A392NSL8_9FABA|nr:hypothetical protein [Trifolium medium]